MDGKPRRTRISRTKLLTLVKAFSAKEIEAGLAATPELLDFTDTRGRNWLHLCAAVDVSRKNAPDAKNSIRLAKLLLKLGLDINKPAFVEGKWCATPLWFAVAQGRNLPLARYLLSSGSTPEHCLWAAAYFEDLKMLSLLINARAPLEAVAESETPLLHAVKNGKFKAAKFLLDNGADPDYQDASGMTALHYMLKKGTDKIHFEMFVRHRAHGHIRDQQGRSAAEIMLRKRDPYFQKAAKSLRTR